MVDLEDYNQRNSEREAMVKEQLIFRGIWNKAVQNSMLAVPRHLFVPEALREYAYCDGPLSIGDGQTISQPYIVAYMIEALNPGKNDIVLEVGTGSGYAAAVLSRLVAMVYTVERLPAHAKRAEALLEKLNYRNIEVIVGDGTRGLPEKAPFDGILVSAGAPTIPNSLLTQLKTGGRLIIPQGTKDSQELKLITKDAHSEIRKRSLGAVHFVPLIGEEGWKR